MQDWYTLVRQETDFILEAIKQQQEGETYYE